MGLADMRYHAPTVCEIFGLRNPQPCEAKALRQIVEAMGHPRQMVTVVFDGFGTAALEAHRQSCPNLRSMCNTHYLEILSVRPPKTPVNFATMATGASQRVHKIHEKTDPLDVETLFQVFEESGLSTCVAARRTGSPAFLFSRRASHAAISQSNRDAEVLDLALRAFSRHQPTFTMLQFLDIDEVEHEVGPFGRGVSGAVSETDQRLGKLIRAVAAAAGTMMVLADHGQHEVTVEQNGKPATRGKHDGTSPQDFLVPLAWCNSEELGLLAQSVV